MAGKRNLTTIQVTREERAALKKKKRGDESYAGLFRRVGLIK
jgi:hypothetical protein